MPDRIDRLARRVSSDPFFLASALADFARSEDLDDAGLAGLLGCTQEDIGRLGLCRRPRPEPTHFLADVQRIAEYVGVDVAALANAVRRADALAEFRRATAQAEFLAAARDRED